MTEIHYYFSVISPFTYLAGVRLESVAAKRNAAVIYKPMDIMRVFGATGGVAPKDRHWSRQEYRLQDMERSAKALNMPINMKPAFFPADQAPASFALIAAQAAGFSVGVLAHAVTRAVWAEEKNIADPAVVDAILEANGVSSAAFGDARDAAPAVFEANTAEAIEKGVFGAPFYLVGDQRFFGGDRLAHLDMHLAEQAQAA